MADTEDEEGIGGCGKSRRTTDDVEVGRSEDALEVDWNGSSGMGGMLLSYNTGSAYP